MFSIRPQLAATFVLLVSGSLSAQVESTGTLPQRAGYPDPGVYFGIPLMNFVGWAVVGLIALSLYFIVDRRMSSLAPSSGVTMQVLLGCALYYGVLIFNLAMTFWIGEPLLGLVGVMIYLPVTLLLALRLLNRLPSAGVAVQTALVQPIASRR